MFSAQPGAANEQLCFKKKIIVTEGHRKIPRSSQTSALTHGVKCHLTGLPQEQRGAMRVGIH